MKINSGSILHQVLILAFALLLGAIVFSLMGSLSAYLFLGVDVFNSDFDINLLPEETQIRIFRIIQPFNTLGTFLFPALVMWFFSRNTISSSFSSNRIMYSSIIGSSLLIIVVKPIVSLLFILNKSIDFSVLGSIGKSLIEASDLLSEKMALVTRSSTIEELVLNMVVIALIPAIAEEFFFRGTIQKMVLKGTKNYHISVWFTAVFFGLIHLNIQAMIPLIFLGGILGYIYHYTQNIWMSILAHFINNASLLLFIYNYGFEITKSEETNISTSALVFSLVMTAALLFFLYTQWEIRNSKKAL